MSKQHDANRQAYTDERSPSYSATQPLLSSAPYAWTQIEVRSYRNAPGTVVAAPLPAPLIFVHLNGSAWLERIVEGRHAARRSTPGDVSIVPPGYSSEWRWDTTRDSVHLELAAGFLAQVAEEAVDIDPARIVLVDRFATHDPLIQQIAVALLSELRQTAQLGRLYAESLAHTLAVHLLRSHSNITPVRLETSGRLTSFALQRAQEYINDNLAQELRVAAIAATVGLSPYHFTRLFKQTVGIAPHQYLIERRVARARELILHSDLPLRDIARQVGFADQSHLARHFKRLLGATPREARQTRTNRQQDGTNLQDPER